MKTCHKVLDVFIDVVDNVLHHFVSYEKFKTFNWRFRSLGSSSWSFCTPQYVLVCSSATSSSFFLCMPLAGEFLVCTRIGVRLIFLVLNFHVLVVCFITTFIKSFEQLLSWKLLVFFITFFTFRFTLRHGWDLLFITGSFKRNVIVKRSFFVIRNV